MKGNDNMEQETEQKFECPNCHSDNIQRYEVAFQNGISSVDTTTAGVGVAGRLGVGVAKTSGTQQSALSQTVAPPAKKGYLGKVILCFFLSLFGAGAGGSMGGIVSTVILVGTLYFFVYKSTYLWNRDVHPQLMEQWQHSYLCLRCGNRFTL